MKSETFASIKFILAVMGLALVAAGKLFSDHADKIDAMDDELPAPDDTDASAPQITPDQISDATRDSNGLPWDARIHSGNKTLNNDGSWKKRKGVSEAVVDAVTAELRALVGTPVAPVAPVAAPVAPVAPVAAPVAPVAAPPVQVPLPVPVPPPVVNEYTQLCDFLAKNSGPGTSLPDDWLKSFFDANSTSLPALATNLELSGKLLTSLRDALRAANIAEVV